MNASVPIIKKQKRQVFSRRLVFDALNSVSEGFALYDKDERIVLWNQKFLDLFPSTFELLERGEYLWTLLHHATLSGDIVVPANSPRDWIQRLVNARKNDQSSFEYQLADGRWIVSKSHRISSGGTVVIFQDVSETKTREEKLIHARDKAAADSQTKSSFLSHMSHELRTPLNAIIGFSEMMDKELFGPIDNEIYHAYVRDILKSAHHLLGVIDDILQVSKAEVGQLELHEEVVDLSIVLEEIIRMMMPRAEAKGIVILKEIQTDIYDFYADDRKVRQILINLLTNALKFTPEGGQILVSLYVQEDLCLAVSDTGEGMKSEDIPRAFEAFRQFESHLSKHENQGVGLGLHLTDNMVKLHGGNIRIESEPAKGTTVTVQFPKERWKMEKKICDM